MLKGRIFHLYHGKYGNRQYISRYSIFDKLGFDVQNNLTKENGIYNLNFDNQLSSWNIELSKYFAIRNRNF